MATANHVPKIKFLQVKTFQLLALLAVIMVAIFFAPGPHNASQRLSVSKGASLTSLSHQLSQAGLVHSGWVFRLGARLQGQAGGLHAGEFELPARASMATILEIFIRGEVVLYPVALPEGLTSQQIIERLEGLAFLNGDVAIPPEGSLLPETYHVPRGFSRAQLIAQMRQAQDDMLAQMWGQRSDNLPFQSRSEAAVLASIVEKETALESERPLVAAVFINRLRKNMRLQSDPTIVYGLVGGVGSLGRPIRRSEIRRKTDYNTYRIEGLPPTPIANFGRAALHAVLHPAETKALYFVANGEGGHVFADSLEAHERNVRKWRQIEGGSR